jgi:ABC-2 type transport system ATP-binding protein
MQDPNGSPPMQGGDAIVEVEGLSKAFGEVGVVDNISLRVPHGQLFGLIGPSGCGKTTLVRLMVGLLAPSEGTIRVLGVDPVQFKPKHREQIGYTPQGFVLYPTLTVRQNANFVAGLYGLRWPRKGRRVRQVLQFLEIWDARKRQARDISGGMQRRLSLACALLHRPGLIFVDEPTAGLDPMLRTKIWDYLRALRDQGTTVVITTQYIDEAIYCDRVGVLNAGQLVAVGSPDELRAQVAGGGALDLTAPALEREDVIALWQLGGVSSVQRTGPATLRLQVDDVTTAAPAVAQVLMQRGRTVDGLTPYVPTFEEVFVKLVNGNAG